MVTENLSVDSSFTTGYCGRCSKHCAWPTSALLGSSLGEWARYGSSGNCPVKTCNVEEILSKVIIISCDYLLVSKMPKKHRKSEENRLFQKTRIQTILDKSPWDSTAIFIFFCYFSVPSLNSSAFSRFPCSSPSPHPIPSWDSEKNSGYTRPTLFVGWGEELDLCELENAPDFCPCL